jgi:hypothetical protein
MGATEGEVEIEYGFTTEVYPLDSTTPITFEWQATDQSGVKRVGGLSDIVSFTWDTPGTKTISVTASNMVNTVDAQIDISIGEADIALGTLTLSGDEEGQVGAECEFTAEVSPLGATTPVTYEWQATDQDGEINKSGLSDTVKFVWDTAGTKTISVTARNGVNELYKQITIEISEVYLEIFMPIVLSR